MIERLNPFLPEFIANPYPFYSRYREEDPIHWGISTHPQLSGAWYIFRYKDVMQVLEDSSFGRESQRVREDIKAVPVSTARSVLSNWMVFLDPPNHTRIRSHVNKAFSQRMAEGIRPVILDIVDNLLDQVQLRGEMDLVEEFAFPLPVIVIATLLGVAPEDRPLFRQWSAALESVITASPESEAYVRAEEAVRGAVDYFKQVIEDSRANPRQDVITALVKAQEKDNKISEEEIIAACIHLLFAGHETTVNLISKGMLSLLHNLDVLKILRTHPEQIPAGVEELLRYDSPVHLVTRWANADTEIGGKLIQRGDSVGLMLGSANRDPMRFENPDILDLQREDGRHCAFGGGIHFCLGSALARAEAQIAFNVLLNRLPGIHLADQKLEWPDSIAFHGPRHLQITFR